MLGAVTMTKQELITYCTDTYRTIPDHPFEDDFVTTVLRHSDTRKWYGLIMEVSRRKFGFESDELIEVVNMKLPVEMFGSFGKGGIVISTPCCVYCPQFFSFSTVKELGGVAIAKGHLLWQI